MDILGTILFLFLLAVIAMVILLILAAGFAIITVSLYFISVILGVVAAILEIPMKRAIIFYAIFAVVAFVLSLLVCNQILGR